MEEPADKWLYEYSVVRFMPKPERGECVNIGLLMVNKRAKWLKGKILIDPLKLKALYPPTDIDSLQRQAILFENFNVPYPELPVEEKYRWLSAVKSASIRVSPSHPGIVSRTNSSKTKEEIMEMEFDRLFELLVK